MPGRVLLADLPGTGDVERMVEQGRHAFDEAQRMRQASVTVERRFILPARMNVEQLRVAHGPKRVNAQAAGLLARGSEDIDQRRRQRALVPGARMESREDKDLQRPRKRGH